MAEWTKYRVGARRKYSNSCRAFKHVYHVAHTDAAVSILRDGKIRPGLVYDDSRLNDKRILVSWLSPNWWSPGFRYGTVLFQYDFESLIRDKSFYWVEVIDYATKALRILITDQNRDGILKPYDPKLREGPWWRDEVSDKHYFNGDHCLEFMIEGPLAINDLTGFRFVDHHDTYCSVHRRDPKTCPELGFMSSHGGALFLAHAISKGLKLKRLREHVVHENGNLAQLQAALTVYWREICRNAEYSGAYTYETLAGRALARAALGAYAIDANSECLALAAMFSDEDALFDALAFLTGKLFALEDWKILKAD